MNKFFKRIKETYPKCSTNEEKNYASFTFKAAFLYELRIQKGIIRMLAANYPQRASIEKGLELISQHQIDQKKIDGRYNILVEPGKVNPEKFTVRIEIPYNNGDLDNDDFINKIIDCCEQFHVALMPLINGFQPQPVGMLQEVMSEGKAIKLDLQDGNQVKSTDVGQNVDQEAGLNDSDLQKEGDIQVQVSNKENDEVYSFDNAIKSYLNGDHEYVLKYVEAGNPPLQFGSTLITDELISYVVHFQDLDQRIINLVESRIDLNAKTVDDGEGYTAVHYAAWDGKADILEFLIKEGASPDIVGEDGYTALHLAASNGHFECVRILVNARVDLDRRLADYNVYFGTKGGTSLTLAFINGFLDLSLYLIESGADASVLLEPCQGNELPTTDLFKNLLILVDKGSIHNFNKKVFDEIKQLVNYNQIKIADAPAEDKSEDEIKDDGRGYPNFDILNPYELPDEVIQNYLMKWQVPSQAYAFAAGIQAYIPDWIEEINEQLRPKFTNSQLGKIALRISEEKIIPVIGYAPTDLFIYSERIWWIVPFCIWKQDIASVVFVDKNGFHALWYDKELDEIEVRFIFPWEEVYNLEFKTKLKGDPFVNRLTLYQESGVYLTFDEFVSSEKQVDKGSYLSVIAAIWDARKETIEASKGESTWFEGAGGEGFVSFDNAKDLLDDQCWSEPFRPNPSIFGFVKKPKFPEIKSFSEFKTLMESENDSIDLEEAYSSLSENLKKDQSIIEYLLSNAGNLFHLLPQEIKKSKSFILSWFEKVKKNLNFSESRLKEDPNNEELKKKFQAANIAAGNAPHILVCMDDSLINDEDILNAALTSKYVSFINKLDPEKWGIDKEWAVKAAKINIHSVHYLPKELKNNVEVCKTLLDVHLGAYNFFEEELKLNRAIQTYALKKDGNVFNIFPDDLKCNKTFIKSILDDCYDNNDYSGYMIFALCEELANDQELIDLAVERNPSIFKKLIAPSNYTKDVFKHYLKVSPYILKFVPDAWQDDRDLMIALLSGGFDSHKRESLFKASAWYNDEAFALDLVQSSDYAHSLKYLREDFRTKSQIVNAFLLKFPEPKNMKQPNEPIEALAFIFIHMAFTDGQATKTEIEAISEVLYDLMESDKQTQILSKRPSTDSVLILNHCLEQYINADSGNFLGNSIQFANEYLSQEEKKMLMNMLALVAKSDGEISEEEKNYYNHLVVEFGFNISNKKTEINKNIQNRKYTGDMYIDLFQMAGIWPSDLDLDNTDPDTLKREYSQLIDSSLRFIKNLEEDSAWYELIPTTSDDTYDQFRIIEDGGTHIGISEIRDRFDDDEMENYPWHKRGPLWYSSNIIINQRFKGPVIFMRDGFISINPKDEDTYVFISWENYSNFQRPDDHRLFLGNENVQLVIQAVNPNSTTQFSFSFASVVLEKLIVANQKSIGKLGLEHPPILPWDKRGVLELIK